MTHTLRTLLAVTVLTAALAPVAFAGGASARVEGPMKDGKYLVRTFACAVPSVMSTTAFAEGEVNGERRTIPITLKRTREKGVLQFERNWPTEGRWLVRLNLGGGRQVSTVATLASNGNVVDNELLWESDGRHECNQKLAVAAK